MALGVFKMIWQIAYVFLLYYVVVVYSLIYLGLGQTVMQIVPHLLSNQTKRDVFANNDTTPT